MTAKEGTHGRQSAFLLADDIQTERVGAGGVPAEWMVAPGAADDHALLYLHGGGYMIGSMRTHCAMVSRLSRAAGVRALGLDDRLAPENPFPATVEDSLAAYRWLLSTGVAPKNIVSGSGSSSVRIPVDGLHPFASLGTLCNATTTVRPLGRTQRQGPGHGQCPPSSPGGRGARKAHQRG